MSAVMGRGAAQWPAAGTLVRIPPRRIDQAHGAADQYACIRYTAAGMRDEGVARIAELPGGALVLLLAAEDVLITSVRVPPLPAARLREALPNLVEDYVLADLSSLHVSAGGAIGAIGAIGDAARPVAVVDRAWLQRVIERFAAAGRQVVAVLPEAQCVPVAEGAWTVSVLSGPISGEQAWLRRGAQEALALPIDPMTALSVLRLLIEQAGAPKVIDLFAPSRARDAWRDALALLAPVHTHASSALRAWFEQGGPTGAFGMPIPLMQNAFASSLMRRGTWTRWRIAACLAVAILVIQLIGLQWQWRRLENERTALRKEAEATLRAAFPETTTILDPALQMSQGMAALRARAGHGDRGDFMALVVASGRLFADQPANSVREFGYQDRSLRVRFAPGLAPSAALQGVLAQRALSEGYELRFESPVADGVSATLRPRSGT